LFGCLYKAKGEVGKMVEKIGGKEFQYILHLHPSDEGTQEGAEMWRISRGGGKRFLQGTDAPAPGVYLFILLLKYFLIFLLFAFFFSFFFFYFNFIFI
jgi:hypothetical protein